MFPVVKWFALLDSVAVSFTFMGPCIVNVLKYNQQDATLHSGMEPPETCRAFMVINTIV